MPKICCKWGKQTKDGQNFTGLVGDLFNGFSDIGWANLFFNYERSNFIDYSDPYKSDYGAFMVKKQALSTIISSLTIFASR